MMLENKAAEAEAAQAVVGAFDSRHSAEQAVDALFTAGFAHDAVGFVMRGDDAVEGGTIVDAEGAKDGKGAAAGAMTGGMVGGVLAAGIALLIPGVGPVVAGGILASFFGGAIAGTAIGGILGAMSGLGISEHEAAYYQKQFNAGKAIVAVKARARAPEAAEVLARFGATDIHIDSHSPIETDGVFTTP